MYRQDILCGISKGTFEIPHKDILPTHRKIKFSYNVEILRALIFKSSYMFFEMLP